MIIVADTSPLNYLIRLGIPDLLPELYGPVLVPKAVLQELQHPKAPAVVQAWAASLPPWLEVVDVQTGIMDFMKALDAGESEAITLAIERKANLLLIDDLIGRQVAESRHITVAGTLVVLADGALAGKLNLYDNLNRLHSLGFRSSPELVNRIIARFEAEKKAE